MKITILKFGEIKLEKVVKNNYEKGVFLNYCRKMYGKGFSICEIQISLSKEDKKFEKSHFKKGEIFKKVHIPKASPKTNYDFYK